MNKNGKYVLFWRVCYPNVAIFQIFIFYLSKILLLYFLLCLLKILLGVLSEIKHLSNFTVKFRKEHLILNFQFQCQSHQNDLAQKMSFHKIVTIQTKSIKLIQIIEMCKWLDLQIVKLERTRVLWILGGKSTWMSMERIIFIVRHKQSESLVCSIDVN